MRLNHMYTSTPTSNACVVNAIKWFKILVTSEKITLIKLARFEIDVLDTFSRHKQKACSCAIILTYLR